MTGLVVLAVALVAAAGIGVYRWRTDGRFTAEVAGFGGRSRTVREPKAQGSAWDVLAASLPDQELGERATLVQFSSAFCAPCRTTRVVLADVAGRADGVRHLEVDAERHLDVVRALDVRRTPTTLVLDASGRELLRAAGAPTRDQVLAALPEPVR